MKLLKTLLILCTLMSNNSFAIHEDEETLPHKRVSTCSWLQNSANDLLEKSRDFIGNNMDEIKQGIFMAIPFALVIGHIGYQQYMVANGCDIVGGGCMGSVCSLGRVICPE